MPSYSIFTKPWRTASTDELIEIVRGLGFDAIEFPLRDGYQVEPGSAESSLPAFTRKLKDNGIRIEDVASTPTEPVLAACAASGIPMVRVMFIPRIQRDYLDQEAQYLKELDSLERLCLKHGVKVGLQTHCGAGATTTADTARIIGRYDPRAIGAVWDAAHSGLAGEQPEQSIDLAWSHLCLVNFKNARYQMAGRAPTGEAEFRPYFCPGQDGQCSWPRAVKRLKDKGYGGAWCVPAEYSDPRSDDELLDYVKRDFAWLRSLVEG
ncbi:MAG: sugar phosphate isomerase/epimerase [Oscillospiraceae bacterium]|jgi:sugar phosphate isomerase/epimerase|nr:sugar phosphate isomerase/epimerase [Oscillospiraceae bacterium]